MSMVLFCSKLNLVSGHIFQIYNDEKLLLKILSILLSDMSMDSFYEKYTEFDGENGEKIIGKIKYNISIKEKDETSIYGILYKNSTIFYKTFDEHTKELIRHSMPHTEGVRFYFDVLKETIVFHTANRLGYQEFNEAMTGIINQCMEDNKREFRFDVVLRTEGLNIFEIEKELRKIDAITELHFRFQPPNPDSETIDNIKQNGESFISTMESANATRVSTVFTSKGSKGLNLDSEMIMDNLNRLQGINSVIGGDSKATSKGYIAVEAVDRHGKKYTTVESKPIKTTINNLNNFVKECKRLILSLH